jgi:pimeloyl-ACP methyl ester carboxylesterase
VTFRSLGTVVAALALAAAGCTSGRSVGTPEVTPLPLGPGHPALAPCEEQGDLLCGSVDVPLDRADPRDGTISVAFYVHRHTDTEADASEPIFATPGGPGSGGLEVMQVLLGMSSLAARHDLVAIDPRGTGKSGAIDCPDLQNGWADHRELERAVAACGAQLGDDADRYGSGDVALDVEAVRRALGYDRIDYYAFSYGTVPEQAYAVRFPEHVRALVFDAGMSVTDPAHAWIWGVGVPAALVREVALMCRRDPACRAPDPASDLRWLVRRLVAGPVRGEVERPGGDPLAVTVGQPEVGKLLRSTGTCIACGQVGPAEVVGAAESLRAGNSEPLLQLVDLRVAPPVGRGPEPAVFSVGDNMAALCNDRDFVWNRTDPIALRRTKFDRAVRALPADAYAPFSRQGWYGINWPGSCLTWPAPGRFVPVIPAGAAFPDVPALILAGDSDTTVPPEIVGTLRAEFPHATFVTVAGAGHPVAGAAGAECAADLTAQLFDRLRVTDTSCARSPRWGDSTP